MSGADSNTVGDIVQETFLAAARALDQFDPDRGTAWAWLAGIAHRQIALHWRRAGRERIDPKGAPVEEATVAGDATSQLRQMETIEAVRRTLVELPSQWASLLEGKYCDACSIAELVEQHGGTTEGVRSMLARARREFKRRYERTNRRNAARAAEEDEQVTNKPAGDSSR